MKWKRMSIRDENGGNVTKLSYLDVIKCQDFIMLAYFVPNFIVFANHLHTQLYILC